MSEGETAQPSLLLFAFFSCCSRYVTFVELIHLNDLLDNVAFLFSTNQRPAKIFHLLTHSLTHKHHFYSPGFANNAANKTLMKHVLLAGHYSHYLSQKVITDYNMP